jgi:hypothetical protein
LKFIFIAFFIFQATFSSVMSAFAQDTEIAPTGRIIAIAGDHINIDLGGSILRGGDVGVIKRNGNQIGVAVVVWVDIGNTNMRVLSKLGNNEAQIGDLVIFESNKETRPEFAAPANSTPDSVPDTVGPTSSAVEPATTSAPNGPAEKPTTIEVAPVIAEPATVSAPAPAETPSTLIGPDANKTTPTLAPVLAPAVARKKTAISTSANIFHGSLRASQLYQTITPGKSWYSFSRLDLDGSVERIHARPWALSWSGNTSYRTGSTFSTADDYRHAKPHLYRIMLTRRFDDGGFLRMGRFFPAELSALGYLDGGQFEHPKSAATKFGSILGFRPNRTNLGFSTKEPIAAVYTSIERGSPQSLYYAGTLGILRSYWEGRADELAALYDQRTNFGPKLNVNVSGQFNFNSGSAAVNKKGALTRGDVTVNSPITTWLSLRGGMNHYQPIDIAAERALAQGNVTYLNNAYFRYWTGTGQTLPHNFQLDEELSWTKSNGATQPGYWRVSMSHSGLPGFESGFLNMSAYNLFNSLGPDYGGTASLSLPFLHNRANVNTNAGLRWGPSFTDRHRKLRVSDLSLHGNWSINTAWNVDIGASRSFTEQIQSTTFNAGLSYRW